MAEIKEGDMILECSANIKYFHLKVTGNITGGDSRFSLKVKSLNVIGDFGSKDSKNGNFTIHATDEIKIGGDIWANEIISQTNDIDCRNACATKMKAKNIKVECDLDAHIVVATNYLHARNINAEQGNITAMKVVAENVVAKSVDFGENKISGSLIVGKRD